MNDDIRMMSGGVVVGGENRPGMVSLNCYVIFVDAVILMLLKNITFILCVALSPTHTTACTYADSILQPLTASKFN